MSVPVRGEHAVVLGASMAGMLAARVAAEHYREVTVVDRDELPGRPVSRRGVPQGAHAHLLQPAGAAVIEELLPGILDELAADGAPVWGDGDLSKVFVQFNDHRFLPTGRIPDAAASYQPSRALLDWHVRQRVSATPNISVLSGHDVVELTASPDRRRVTGVLVARRGDVETRVLGADLVIDASGRGSRAPVFLERLGYGRPVEDEMVVNLAYSSQWLRIPPGAIRQIMVLCSPKPGESNSIAILVHEGGHWLMTVGTLAGSAPARDYPDMVRIAERRLPEDIGAALRAAEPIGGTAHYRTPSTRWRRYDTMARLPHGFVVTGDAVCSFNPIYGQGMAVAALDAMALRRCLRGGDKDLPCRFFRDSARTVRVAWRNATSADLSLPEVDGKRTLATRLNGAYTEWVLGAIETDPVVTSQFLRVVGMLDAPTRLMRPTILARVLRANLSRPAGRAAEPELSLAG